MKLSDVRGDRTIDVIADVIGPISNIAEDENAMELFKAKDVPEGMTQQQFFAKRVKKSAPALLRDHKQDVIAILAAIEGVTPEEYAESLNLAKLLGDMVELMTDETILDFLPQSTSGEESLEGASESTQAQQEQTLSVVS